MTAAMYESACFWLDRGFGLLPVQPGTKKQAFGYGAHQKVIKDRGLAASYFRDNKAVPWNMAAVCPPGYFVLDFDTWQMYLDWVKFVREFDQALAWTYTEITPHGAHVWLRGELPTGYNVRPGVEIKKTVVVFPSIIGDDFYSILFGSDIYAGSLDAALYPIRGSALPSTSWTWVSGRVVVSSSMSKTPLDFIKVRLSLVDLFRDHYPKNVLKGRGKFLSARCPFHDDQIDSFFINTQNNTYGCHACKARGDVINFYALVNHLTNDQAIKRLMAASYDC